jgi:hypothetical protein
MPGRSGTKKAFAIGVGMTFTVPRRETHPGQRCEVANCLAEELYPDTNAPQTFSFQRNGNDRLAKNALASAPVSRPPENIQGWLLILNFSFTY